jgi:hypothetical protein
LPSDSPLPNPSEPETTPGIGNAPPANDRAGSDNNDAGPDDEGPALVTLIKEKRPRHRKGEPVARPGKVSWVHGTKQTFFERRRDEWLRERDAKRSGAFYSKITKLYLKKYGYRMRDDQDLAEDLEDPPDSAANEVIHEILDEREKAFRDEYTKTLRTVRRIIGLPENEGLTSRCPAHRSMVQDGIRRSHQSRQEFLPGTLPGGARRRTCKASPRARYPLLLPKILRRPD